MPRHRPHTACLSLIPSHEGFSSAGTDVFIATLGKQSENLPLFRFSLISSVLYPRQWLQVTISTLKSYVMAFFKLECVCQEIVYLLLHLLLLFIIIIVIVVIIVTIIIISSTVRGKYIMLDSTAQKRQGCYSSLCPGPASSKGVFPAGTYIRSTQIQHKCAHTVTKITGRHKEHSQHKQHQHPSLG